MSNIYLASYKGTDKGLGGIVDRTIRFFTKGTYSHSEITIGNPFEAAVLCVTSAGQEGGVRGKVMQLTPDRWDITPLPSVYAQEVLNALNAHKGEKYDGIGCVRAILPFVSHEHETRWFCSEFCAMIIGLKDAWRFHPSALHAVMNSKR